MQACGLRRAKHATPTDASRRPFGDRSADERTGLRSTNRRAIRTVWPTSLAPYSEHSRARHVCITRRAAQGHLRKFYRPLTHSDSSMRPFLKLYDGLVIASAALLLVHDLRVLVDWGYPSSLGVTIALMVLTAVGDQLQFEVHRGWHASASAVPHIAAAFLLPPPEAMAIAALGLALRALRYPRPAGKTAFHVASMALAVGGAAHVAD